MYLYRISYRLAVGRGIALAVSTSIPESYSSNTHDLFFLISRTICPYRGFLYNGPPVTGILSFGQQRLGAVEGKHRSNLYFCKWREGGYDTQMIVDYS